MNADMTELMDAVDNLLISKGMGWDLDGAFERLSAAKMRVDMVTNSHLAREETNSK